STKEVLASSLWRNLVGELATLASNPSVHFRLYEFRGGERESDVEVIRHLHEALEPHFGPRVTVSQFEANPWMTLSDLAKCKAFIATRYHSLVFAYLMQVPVLYVPYHTKLDAFAN